MKSRKTLVMLTLGFTGLGAIMAFFNGDAAVIPFFLAAICFVGYIISLILGAFREDRAIEVKKD